MATLRLRPDIEDALRRIQGVRAASVVTTAHGQPTEIHVLAAPGKQPKQVVRDVQSLAMAQFDLDIDHRIVSVVQLDDADLRDRSAVPAPVAPSFSAQAEPGPQHRSHEDEWPSSAAASFAADAAVPGPASDPVGMAARTEPAVIDLREREPVGLSVVGSERQGAASAARVMLLPDALAAESAAEEEPAPRPAISSIMVRTSNGESEATVTVGAGGHSFEGRVVGPAGATHRPRLVAQATLAAVADLLGQSCEIESAQLTAAGMRTVAVSVVTIETPRIGEQVLSGSAVVRGDEADAVARSVLDALNRRISG
jgi:hypothetical protein